MSERSRFRIGDIAVHPDRCAIVRDGKEISLRPLTMNLLVKLAHNDRQVVSRELLLEDVWKNKELDDNPINRAFNELRKKLGDDANNPLYIKTVRNGGYRLIPPAVFEKDYRSFRKQERSWFNGSPFVGLTAFDEAYADVFFGRDRMREKVFRGMRAQFESGSRFVLLHGASGSGKTSLLNAGVIPKLTKPVSVEDLRALAVARCDLASAQSGDAIGALATALATWKLGDHPVFPSELIEDLKNFLIETPESIERVIDEAFQRHPDREAAEHPLAHLLLVIDHGEKLVDAAPTDASAHKRFTRALTALCGSERTLAVMIVRGDFYQKLQDALPELMELKGSQGHIDVVRPNPHEIAEMINAPAECAGLDFERNPDTGEYLDYRLCEDARGKPDALPLLQHTLRQLYDKRDQEKNLLTFAAYSEMGGLEGGIAHRAEEVFASLPVEVQASLDDVLSLLVEVQDTGVVSGKHSSFDSLDSGAQTLVKAFISARLFVSEQDDHHCPHFGVTHEALLRRWPKASDWSKKNLRLLKARTELKIATDRWKINGRRQDNLLNPGRPLDEALEAAAAVSSPLSDDEQAFLALSNQQRIRKARIRTGVIASLTALGLASVAMATLAFLSRSDAIRERNRSSDLTAYAVGELAERLDVKADMELIESVTSKILGYCRDLDTTSASMGELVACSRASRKLGEVRMDQNRLEEASALVGHAAILSGQAVAGDPSSKAALNEAGQAYAWVGKVHLRRNDLDGAKTAWQSYLAYAQLLIKHHPSDHEGTIQKSFALRNLGHIENVMGNQDIALGFFKRSAALKTKARGYRTNDNLLEYELAVTSSFISTIEASKGYLRDAEKGFASQIDSLHRLLKDDPTARDWEQQLAKLLHMHADVAYNLGEIGLAEKSISESIERLTSLCKKEPDNQDWAKSLSQAHLFASDITKRNGDNLGSVSHLESALQSIRITKNSPDTWKRIHAMIIFKHAMARNDINSKREIENAIQTLRKVVRDGNDKHARLALTEALLLMIEREIDLKIESSSDLYADEALKVIEPIRGKDDDIAVVALNVRAEVAKSSDRADCVAIRKLADIGYRNPAYEKSIVGLRQSCNPI